MGHEAKKIEHSGAKKANGSYWGYKKGSSSNAGEGSSNLQEKVVRITKTIGHSFNDFNLIVYAF